jgi:hypothetical protein
MSPPTDAAVDKAMTGVPSAIAVAEPTKPAKPSSPLSTSVIIILFACIFVPCQLLYDAMIDPTPAPTTAAPTSARPRVYCCISGG